ncbi:MAG: F420-0:Gamma-glutamyl ligase, partial [Leptolyngbyaceae cyanobacterium CSU_1_4]|nr:F420-0:Gamma-glutamyl ligase [Leptolyngbyaceae cyanobacterium CSU_1_4]
MTGVVLAILVLLIALGGLLIEKQYRNRPGNALEATSGTWDIQTDRPDHYRLVGNLELINHTRHFEIMVPELTAEVKLLSK